MLKIGDTVKIINNNSNNATDYVVRWMDYCVGTIGKITDISKEEDGSLYYCVDSDYWWLETNLEKGHMVWVKDED